MIIKERVGRERKAEERHEGKEVIGKNKKI